MNRHCKSKLEGEMILEHCIAWLGSAADARPMVAFQVAYALSRGSRQDRELNSQIAPRRSGEFAVGSKNSTHILCRRPRITSALHPHYIRVSSSKTEGVSYPFSTHLTNPLPFQKKFVQSYSLFIPHGVSCKKRFITTSVLFFLNS